MSDWTPELAELITAAGEQISLSDAHWEVIHFVRVIFYTEYKTSRYSRISKSMV